MLATMATVAIGILKNKKEGSLKIALVHSTVLLNIALAHVIFAISLILNMG